ncbi:MAG: hypothetical protein ACRDRJ_04915 [Streptosporangiaceae bacterium]
MHPALTNTLSLISNTYRSAKQKPLTTGAAALTAAAVTGVSLGAAFGPTASVGAASHLNLAAHPAAVTAAGQAGGPLYAADSGLAPSGHRSPADLPRHPAVSARLAVRPEHPTAPAPKHPAPAKHQPATRHVVAKAVTKDAVAKHPAARHAPAKPAQRARHQAAPKHQAPARPFQIYDSVTPGQIPAHHQIATYATGNYAASPAEVAGRGPVMWIDTTGSDYAASVLDVEPGDATPTVAANWAFHRLSQHRTGVARIYTMISEWSAVKSAVATLPSWMRSHIRWWIADPTGSPHIVPGASATQWYWGSHYDITSASPGF